MLNLCIFKSLDRENDEIKSIPYILEQLPIKKITLPFYGKVEEIIDYLFRTLYALIPHSTYFGLCKYRKGVISTVSPANNMYIYNALKSHCIISSLFTSFYLMDSKSTITAYQYATKIENEKYEMPENGWKRAKDFIEIDEIKHLSDFHRSDRNKTQFSEVWKEYSFCLLRMHIHVKRLFTLDLSSNKTVNNAFASFLLLDKMLNSDDYKPSSINNYAVRNILHTYLVERYFSFDLIKRVFAYVKEDSNSCFDWKTKERSITQILANFKLLPNAFSRGSFLAYTFNSLYNNYYRKLVDDVLACEEENDHNVFRNKKRTIPIAWNIEVNDFINQLSYISIPLLEKLFFYNLLEISDYSAERVIAELSQYVEENENRLLCRYPHNKVISRGYYEDNSFKKLSARFELPENLDESEVKIFKYLVHEFYHSNFDDIYNRHFSEDYFRYSSRLKQPHVPATSVYSNTEKEAVRDFVMFNQIKYDKLTRHEVKYPISIIKDIHNIDNLRK